MTTAEAAIAPLVKVATVPQDQVAAFRLFTERFGAWWPLATHSVGGADATDVVFGAGVGEQLIETMRGGETAVWGTVTAWDPPRRVAFTWHPGAPEDEATDVDVSFTPRESGTIITLTHTGWERRPDGHQARAGYDPGWDFVLGHLTAWAE